MRSPVVQCFLVDYFSRVEISQKIAMTFHFADLFERQMRIFCHKDKNSICHLYPMEILLLAQLALLKSVKSQNRKCGGPLHTGTEDKRKPLWSTRRMLSRLKIWENYHVKLKGHVCFTKTYKHWSIERFLVTKHKRYYVQNSNWHCEIITKPRQNAIPVFYM